MSIEDNLLNMVQQDFTNPVAEVIKNFTASGYSEENTFTLLMEQAVDHTCISSNQFREVCFFGEKEVLDYLESLGEVCTYRSKKDGSIDISKGTLGYKISKVCPTGTYSSAKSVICKALDKEIALVYPDGKYKGKSELEKECKDLTLMKSYSSSLLSEYERAVGVVDVLCRICTKLDNSEINSIRELLKRSFFIIEDEYYDT
jgi:hypothetical protein